MTKDPKPILYKSIFQARYTPKLEFYDAMYAAAREFKEFAHWQTDRLKVTVFDFGKRCSLTMAFDSFSYTQDSSSLDQEQALIKQAIDILPSSLHIDDFSYLGLRRFFLMPVAMSFENLVSVLDVKLLSQNDKLKALLNDQVSDLTSIIICKDNEYKYRVMIGPMRKTEITGFIPVDQEHHLDVKNRDALYLEIKNTYPDVSVYLDMDYFQQDGSINSSSVSSFVSAADQKIREFVEELPAYLFKSTVEE